MDNPINPINFIYSAHLLLYCIQLFNQQISYISYVSFIYIIMDKFINDIVRPMFTGFTLEDHILNQKLSMFESDLKIFLNFQLKTQAATINKQLSKKTRELFILSSDNEALKQNIEQLQSSVQSLKSEVSSLDQQKTKQKVMLEKQIAEFNQQFENYKKQSKKDIERLKMEKSNSEEQFKDKMREMKKQHQAQLSHLIEEEKRVQEELVETLKGEFEEQKSHILQQNNEKKRELIKKYEQKIAVITGQYEDKIYLLKKEMQDLNQATKQLKSALQNKISVLENNNSRLKSDLGKESNQHQKYHELYEKVYQQLSGFQEKSLKQKQLIQQELHELNKKMSQSQRKYLQQIRDLNSLLNKTIEDKDAKYVEMVETLTTEHKIKFDAMENRLTEQRQIAVNQVEILRDKQNYENDMKIQKLTAEYEQVKRSLTTISVDYETKMNIIKTEHEDQVFNLNMRKQYELNVNSKNSNREFEELQNKYELQLVAIQKEHVRDLEEAAKKSNEQKLALTNKLTTQYQSVISDQKSSTEIQIKQKLIEFDRKAKGYEAKLRDAQKKKGELKIAVERVKMEMQMRVDSMVELNETYEEQIANMNEKIKDIERDKQRIVNEYELKILMLKNEMKQAKQEFQSRQVDLKEILENKLSAKNKETSKILAKIKKQTEDLIEKHNKRVQAQQKEYVELKRVLGQKTSLPEDIEALKLFHGAYVQKQQELAKEKLKVERLKKQLMTKDAVDRVFAEKAFKRVHKNYNSTNPNTLISFKSNQL